MDRAVLARGSAESDLREQTAVTEKSSRLAVEVRQAGEQLRLAEEGQIERPSQSCGRSELAGVPPRANHRAVRRSSERGPEYASQFSGGRHAAPAFQISLQIEVVDRGR